MSFTLPAYRAPDFTALGLEDAPEVQLVPVERDGVAPAGYHATTLFPEYFRLNGDANLWLTTTKAPRSYVECDWRGDVTLMFGKETAGLPEWLREKYRDRCIRIPMISEARSLNLSNAAAILTYEALRQQGFKGLKDYGNMKQEELA